MTKKGLSYLLIGLLISGVALFSGCRRHSHEHKAEFMVDYISETLDLNESQQEQLDQIKDELLTKAQDMHADKASMHEELVVQLRSEEIDQVVDCRFHFDDLVGVARAMDDPTFITLNAKSKLNSLEDIVAASKEKPLSWGVSVLGSTEHIGLAQLAEAAGFEYKAVPFESGGQMVNALMSGAIDATLPNVSEARQQIMDGTLKAVAVMSSKRLSGYPDIPTTYEKGYEVDCSTTRGYAVLKGTPDDRIFNDDDIFTF